MPATQEAYCVLHSRRGLPGFHMSLRVLVLESLAKKVSFPALNPFRDHPELKEAGQPLADDWPKGAPEVLDIVLGQDYISQIWKGNPIPTSKFGNRGPT